ncbi:hypothetical protein EG329_011959 [Mollisiaceae sp. DMI_Dod_QoI]|nr:hypothetical protein EG329_011959 [Helotiales sp. DMI_Dod_QoI]
MTVQKDNPPTPSPLIPPSTINYLTQEPNIEDISQKHYNGKLIITSCSYRSDRGASEDDIKSAFQRGDEDNDDGLSISEASEALEKLSGKSIDEATIEAACDSVGVSVTSSHEMDFDEFKSVVRHLEEEGKL